MEDERGAKTCLDSASFDMRSGSVRFRASGPERALSEATGEMGNSCHRCLLAVGIMGLLVGGAATGVAYGRGAVGSPVLPALGLGLLGAAGLALVGSWVASRLSRRQKLRRAGSVAQLVGEGQAA